MIPPMTGLPLPPDAEGVLPSQLLAAAVACGAISAGPYRIEDESIQPASLDLRLGDVAYRLRCSFLPGRDTVEAKMEQYVIDDLDLSKDGAVLETHRPYLIPLVERLRLPPGVRGRANPKSSTGRLDVFTRVITDHSHQFDEIEPGYEGRLYLEVVPLSFTIKARELLALNQLRLIVGQPRLSDDELRQRHGEQALLFSGGQPVANRDLAVDHGLFLSLDLRGDGDARVGYRARDYSPLLDVSRVGAYDPREYWDLVVREDGNRVVLAPERFYLLLSEEAVCIPPDLAAEMTAYDPTSGELRTHYAGFFDPGFGHDDAGLRGSRATLEVRAHDVPFVVESGQRVCKLSFERMYEPPTTTYGQDMNSNYQSQVVTLSKHFRIAPPVKQPRLRWGP